MGVLEVQNEADQSVRSELFHPCTDAATHNQCAGQIEHDGVIIQCACYHHLVDAVHRQNLEDLLRANEVIAKIGASIGRAHGQVMVICPLGEQCGASIPACEGHRALREAVRYVEGLR